MVSSEYDSDLFCKYNLKFPFFSWLQFQEEERRKREKLEQIMEENRRKMEEAQRKLVGLLKLASGVRHTLPLCTDVFLSLCLGPLENYYRHVVAPANQNDCR